MAHLPDTLKFLICKQTLLWLENGFIAKHHFAHHCGRWLDVVVLSDVVVGIVDELVPVEPTMLHFGIMLSLVAWRIMRCFVNAEVWQVADTDMSLPASWTHPHLAVTALVLETRFT